MERCQRRSVRSTGAHGWDAEEHVDQPAGARPDGDPASDFLISRDVFLPYSAEIDDDTLTRLETVVRDAGERGFRIRVALIAQPYDLGSVFPLCERGRPLCRRREGAQAASPAARGGMSARGRRVTAGAVAAAFVLATPGPALAHSRSPTVALDVRLRVAPIPGARPSVLDGNRRLRLTVDRGHALIVRGLLGEPVLRFGDDGVWANLSSPTTAADRITSRRGSGWARLTRGRSFIWHDHRLAPPRLLRPGATAPFALPVFLDGRPETITGMFTFVPRPAWWPWVAGGVIALLAAIAAARRLPPSRRSDVAWLTALAAAVGALLASIGFATGGALGAASEWALVACSMGLVLLGVVVFAARRSLRTMAAGLIGVAAVVLTLPKVVVFWHGVVISSLSPGLARLAVGTAVVGGFAAAGISLAAGADELRSVAPEEA